MNADSIVQVEYGGDALRVLADLLLDQASAELPDLSHRVVLLASPGAIARFQGVLLDRATLRSLPALIPPVTDTLRAWLRRYAPERAILSEAERDLLLLEALNDYPGLAERTGTWPLIHSVLELFDDLNLNAGRFPNELSALTDCLARGYGIADTDFVPLADEARLVYRLWQAWRERLAELDALDSSLALAASLQQSLTHLDAVKHIYLAGHVRLSKVELGWAKTLLARGRLSLIVQGQTGARGYHPDSALTEMLNELDAPQTQFDTVDGYTLALNLSLGEIDTDLTTRVRTLTERQPQSPLHDRLSLYEAGHAEDEACVIDLQVRRWWLEGWRDIGIVTNDRKLARRVRALLERANLALHDSAGWPLSTTSAASVLERWLESLEQGFNHRPLLDLLRSSFVRLAGLEHQRETSARFEHGVIQRLGIPAGVRRYQDAVQQLRPTLEDRYGTGSTDDILRLLAALTDAAAPLQRLFGSVRRPARDYLAALSASLDALGLTDSYRQDPAGSLLLDTLAEMRAAAATRSSPLNWTGFRGWLRRNLERAHFRPTTSAPGVTVTDFAGSRLQRYDAVIVAGTHREQLPGTLGTPAIFNDAVRRELGLPCGADARNELFYDFRRLLEAAPRVVVTLRREQQGNPLVAGPWIERIRTFHRLAYGDALVARDLTALRAVHSPICRIETGPLPSAQDYPRVAAPALIPRVLSASSYQSLLDCPYQFYARYGLALSPYDDVDDDIDKADYGSHVHRILQAFHCGQSGLPGPFDAALTAATLARAQTLMQEITDAVFAADERHSFGARAWRYRWQQSIPHYLAWQTERASAWRVQACEQRRERRLDEASGPVLTGKLDRIDHDGAGCAIIDYKTGVLPRMDDITGGERIQLVFYALLMDVPIKQALYLRIGDASTDSKLCLEESTLAELSAQEGVRLAELYRQLRAGAKMPAWGDRPTCERCEMAGLCRKQYWNS